MLTSTRRPGNGRLPSVIGGALTTAFLLLAGCSPAPAASGAEGPNPTSQPSFAISLPNPTSSPPRGASPIPAAAASPTAAAEQWLIAYHTLTWTDPGPTAWISHVRPYVTASLAATDDQVSDAGGGADWTSFVSQQCTDTVTDVGAVIPPEAPGTASAVNVQVTGTVLTVCDAGTPPDPRTSVSATLVMVPGPAGTWLVNQRLF